MRFSTFATTAVVFAAGTHAAVSSSFASPSAYTPYINFNTVAYITETVSAYTTYFSAPTQLALPDTTYTISEPTTLTLTHGGPFTVVRPLVAQTIVAGCATCYATAPLLPFATPSLDANGTSVGTALLKTTATATATAAPSSSSASSASSKQAHATTTTAKSATTPSSSSASSKQGQQQSQSGKTLTLPSVEPSAAGGAVTADTLAPAPTTATAVDAAVSSSVDAAAPVYTGAAGRVGSSSMALLGRAVVAALAVLGLGRW
ncbi:uncharacterized protein J3D65DRAFT_74139 [Phyllosticta citribraziliensis]|uniref:Uncharacterized protein n=1 Tax=Phyllosticta citribraziliensis TaxID=989973 RepID=A0ABR1LH50_9PEZI